MFGQLFNQDQTIMLSRLTLRYLMTSTNLAYYCGGLSFHFVQLPKSGQKVLRVNSRKSWKRLFQWAHRIIDLTYVLFIAYRLFEVVNTSDIQRAGAIVQLTYFLISYTLNLVYDVQTLFRGDVIPYFLTQHINLFKKIQYRYLYSARIDNPRITGQFVKCNVFLTVIFIIGVVINCQYLIYIIKKPENPRFFTSLLTQPERQSFGLRLPLTFLQCWVWANLWTSIYFYVMTNYIYNCGGIYLLQELK